MNRTGWIGDPKKPLDGFKWKLGSKVFTESPGILVWTDVFLHDDAEGNKFAIILMDVQGINHSLQWENTRFLTFSSFISSVQIYSLMNKLQNDDLRLFKVNALKTLNNNNIIQ